MTTPISPDFTLPDVEDYTDDITKDSDFTSLKHLSDADRNDLSKWMKLVLDSQSRQVAKIAEINARQVREGRIVKVIEIGALLTVAVGMALVANAIKGYNPPLPVVNNKANDEIMAAMLEKLDRPNPELIKLQEQIKALQVKKPAQIITRTVYLSPVKKLTRVKPKHKQVKHKKPVVVTKPTQPIIDTGKKAAETPKKVLLDFDDATGAPVLKEVN